jgi:hypothetical protein
LLHGDQTPETYLALLLGQLESLTALPQPEVWYASQETPLFYYTLQPELLAFKLYMWQKTRWTQTPLPPVFSAERFYAQWPGAEVLRRHILQRYFSVPALELWSAHALEHTLRQIQVARHGRFLHENGGWQTLLNAVGGMLDTVGLMARTGKRTAYGDAPLSVCFNDIDYTNNTVLIRSRGATVAAYTVYDNPNYLVTRQPQALQRLETWIDTVKRQAIPIGNDGERYRSALLDHYRRQLDAAAQRLERGDLV